MMRKFGTFAVVMAASAALIATPALAVRKRMTTTGVVTDGIDNLGLFGTAGADLAGKTLTLSFVYDTALGERQFNSATNNELITQNGTGPFLLVTGTIDGVTYRLPDYFFGTPSTALFRRDDGTSDTNLYIVKEANFRDGAEYYSGSLIGKIDGRNFDFETNTKLTGAAISRLGSGIYGYTTADNGDEVFSSINATVGSLAITGNVPEPASWAMMIAGFGLVGATMRRRREAGAATAFTA